MTCESTEEKLAEAKQLIADFANEAQERGLIDMSAVPGFAVPTLLMGGAALPGEYAYRTHIEDTANATTYSGGSWNNIAIGDADANRYVLVAVWGNGQTRTVSSMTIGGVSATLVSDGTDSARLQHSNGTGEFWIANVPTGTTANISVTWSGAQDRCGATVWTIVRPTSTTAVDVKTSNSASPASVTLDTASNGVVFAIHGQNGGGTCTWTNVTERHDTTIEASATHTGADAATAGSSLAVTATYTGSPAVRTLVAVSFNLAATVPTAPRILDSYSNVTGAWSMSRLLKSSFEGNDLYTTATGVNSLKDQSGSGINLDQSTGANQPSVLTSGVPRTAARFDGVNDILSNAGAGIFTTLFTASAGYMAVCAVIRAISTNDATPSNNGILAGGLAGNTGGIFFRNNGSSQSWGVYNHDGNQDECGATANIIDQIAVYEWRHEGGYLYGRMTPQGGTPGAWQSVVSGDTSGPQRFYLGGQGATTYIQCDIFEVVTFNVVPNDTQKDALVSNMLAHYS